MTNIRGEDDGCGLCDEGTCSAHPPVPDCLRVLSAEELAKLPILTKEMIDEALMEGARQRDLARAAMMGRKG